MTLENNKTIAAGFPAPVVMERTAHVMVVKVLIVNNLPCTPTSGFWVG
jgi:hypothetical protein